MTVIGCKFTSQVNSEFYTGWLDHWGDQHAAVDSRKVSRVLDQMLVMGANVNMYVSSNTSSSSSSHMFILPNSFTRLKLVCLMTPCLV